MQANRQTNESAQTTRKKNREGVYLPLTQTGIEQNVELDKLVREDKMRRLNDIKKYIALGARHCEAFAGLRR